MAKSKKPANCHRVTICGKRRKLCWGKHGIKSNSKG